MTTIPHLVAGVLAELSRRESVLGAQLHRTARQLRDMPTRTMEENRLRRNVEAREQLYTTLKQKYEEATLAEASAMPDVSILDSPVAPERPSSNRAPFIILLAFVISAVIAVAVAVLLDRIDARFRYPEQAINEMGLEVLGAVPALKERSRGARSRGGRAAGRGVAQHSPQPHARVQRVRTHPVHGVQPRAGRWQVARELAPRNVVRRSRHADDPHRR